MAGVLIILVAVLIAVTGVGAMVSGIRGELRRREDVKRYLSQASHPAAASRRVEDAGTELMAEIEEWLKQQQ